MKFTVPAAMFKQAFDVASLYVQPKADNLPTSSIRLEVGPKESFLVAQNNAGGIGVRVPISQVECQSPGVVLINPGQMGRIIDSVKAETLKIELDETKLKIAAKRSKWTVNTTASDKFLVADYDNKEYDFIVKADDLIKLAGRVEPLAGDDTNSYLLGAVHFRYANDNLHVQVTDGRVTGFFRCPIETGADSGEALIPAKSLKLLRSTFDEPENVLMVTCRKNEVAISDQFGLSAILRTSVGRFPNLDAIRTASMIMSDGIEAKPFLDAIRQATAVVDDGADTTTLTIRLESDRFILESEATEKGEATVEFEAHWPHEPVALHMGPGHLTRVIRATGDQPFQLGFQVINEIRNVAVHALGYDGFTAPRSVAQPKSEVAA